MKKIMILSVLMMSILSTGFANDSHALIGMAFRSKPVKVVGAIGVGAGTFTGVYGFATLATTANFGTAIGGAVLTGYGIIFAAIGLVILDEKQISDIEFRAIDVQKPEFYRGFTRAQVETYNSELAQLNSIRQTMIAESSDIEDTADAEALWKKYSTYLSNDTVQIAQKNAADFLAVIR